MFPDSYIYDIFSALPLYLSQHISNPSIRFLIFPQKFLQLLYMYARFYIIVVLVNIIKIHNSYLIGVYKWILYFLGRIYLKYMNFQPF